MPSAPSDRIEAGVPAFVVYGPEAVGLVNSPTDLEILPDGRVLLVSGTDLVFGDSVRWELRRAAEGEPPVFRDVAVGADGTIYYGTNGAIARVELGEHGRWRARPVLTLPDDPEVRRKTMVSVTAVRDEWYWFAGTGMMLNWRPGAEPQLVPNRTTVQTIFRAADRLFVSDSNGGLFQVGEQGQFEAVPHVERLVSEAIVSSVPYGDGRHVLNGTNFHGLRLFDGVDQKPFGTGVLAGDVRINALCAVGPDHFAAAIDTFGVVIFDREGRILQTLDAKLDHRLARPERLQYADGVLWVLLNQGIARVEYPSAISRFEPLVASGLSFAQPLRFNGDLWLIADGRALRGVYSNTGNLQGFELDSPPGRFVFTLTVYDGQLFAGSDVGLFTRGPQGWEVVATGIVNARVGFARNPAGDIIYAARGEIGTLRRNGDTYLLRRIPIPGLGDNYNAFTGRDGLTWLELGNKAVACLDPRGDEPILTRFGGEHGLIDGWVAAMPIEGEVRFQLPNVILRFDQRSRRFVRDAELIARVPDIAASSSRPAQDGNGHLWYSNQGTVYRVNLRDPAARPVPLSLPFPVITFTFEENGVTWFFGERRLGRLDPRLAVASAPLPRVLITRALFPNSGRTVFSLGTGLGAIPYADNTVAFNFVSPGNPASPVSFEVRLGGVNEDWVSTGNVGQAVFNRLKEGRYVFQVRAVRAGGFASPPASVAFEIQPPWFRSPLAWLAYVLVGGGVLAGAIWYPSVRQRRENARLELLVGKRTEELNATNRELERQVEETTRKSCALMISEERYRSLSAQLEQRVQERTAELSLSNVELQQRESLFRLIFEHAPVGISWKRADLDNLHHFNSTYRRILDLKTDTHPDFEPLRRLVHPDDTPALQALETRIATGQLDSDRLELRFIVPGDRLVWASLCVAVVRDQGRIIQVIGILEDITARKDAETQLATTYKELLGASRLAGMAEVATGVLHNVGNVLNSLNVSSNLLANQIRQSRAESLVKLSALLREHAGDLGEFITRDPKGSRVPELLEKLAQAASNEREWLLQEVASMQKNIDHIKDIVAMQQSYATVLGVVETLEPASLFEDALRMNAAALSRHDVRVVREFLPSPLVSVEKGKVLQILTNVIRNAKYACDDGQQYGTKEKVVTVRVEPGPGTVRFIVRDTGIGIAPENLTRIFAHGFTTRAYGHGFGLHSSALAAREMKGTLTASSAGLGKGATFVLEIPAAPADARLDRPASANPFDSQAESTRAAGI